MMSSRAADAASTRQTLRGKFGASLGLMIVAPRDGSEFVCQRYGIERSEFNESAESGLAGQPRNAKSVARATVLRS